MSNANAELYTLAKDVLRYLQESKVARSYGVLRT